METIYLGECPEGLYIEQRGRGGKGRTTEKLKPEIEKDLIVGVQRLRAENAYIKNKCLGCRPLSQHILLLHEKTERSRRIRGTERKNLLHSG